MRTATSLLVGAFLLAGTASGADTAQKGIELSDMDRKVDPCTDFFEFANGAWRAANPIPASLPRWSRRWAAGESTKEQLKQLLDETTAAGNAAPGSVEQLIGDYYGSCMDEATVNRLGAKPLEPLLVEIRSMKSSADVSNMIGRFHRMGIAVPFYFGGESDAHNPNDVIAKVYASGLGMPDRDYYVKTEDRFKEARAKYLAHVAAIFRLAGESDARAKAEADTVLRMETKLAEASLDNVALRDPKATDHKTSFADLQKMTPHFPWAGYYKTAGVTPGDLNVAEPKFLAEFDRQLASTPLADWKVYLQWHLVNAAASSLSDPFVQEDWEFNGKFLSGAKELKPRWKRCVESTDRQLGEALGRKYVEKYFPPEAKARMQEMVANLRLAMKETIEGLDWMSPATKKRALEKLSTFNPKVGYPDRWKDYSKVTIRRGTFWEDMVAGRQFNVEDVRGTIGKPVDRGRWGMTPPTSDAYYNPLLNELVFPAGILQPPAFSMQNNDAVNYGAIGVVIGHEISHGFDDEGAQFDAQGRLNNWWTDEDLKRFQDKAACVVRQFDGYFVEPGIHHNGKLVLGESIGDLAGAKIAYRAFQISQKGKPPLPDVEGFTPDQQFFIAWGQFRGDAVRPEFARTMVQGDPHPIGKFRVIGPLSNLTEFQKAFECKPGSAMVRPAPDRCEVW
jgi:endothelin-converting enzyme/putative endopeptidase